MKSNFKFKWDFTVLEIFLDTFGHMNHAVYLELFEQARWEFIRSRGFGLDQIQSLRKGPVILDLKIRYMRELRLGEKITIVSQTTEHGSKIGRIHQVMVNERGQDCSEIDLTVGFFDLVTRKLISPPPEWLHAVGANE